MFWGPIIVLLLYGKIDLEEIQLSKNILLFCWGKPLHAKTVSFLSTFTYQLSDFVASASEGLPMYFNKTRNSFISNAKLNN